MLDWAFTRETWNDTGSLLQLLILKDVTSDRTGRPPGCSATQLWSTEATKYVPVL